MGKVPQRGNQEHKGIFRVRKKAHKTPIFYPPFPQGSAKALKQIWVPSKPHGPPGWSSGGCCFHTNPSVGLQTLGQPRFSARLLLLCLSNVAPSASSCCCCQDAHSQGVTGSTRALPFTSRCQIGCSDWRRAPRNKNKQRKTRALLRGEGAAALRSPGAWRGHRHADLGQEGLGCKVVVWFPSKKKSQMSRPGAWGHCTDPPSTPSSSFSTWGHCTDPLKSPSTQTEWSQCLKAPHRPP